MKHIASELVSRSLKASEPKDEDYFGDDGLLYCGRCHTRKQTIVKLFDQDELVGIMCRCEKERYEAEDALEKKRKRYFSVMQHVDWCDIRAKGKRETCHPRVLQYLDHWPEMLEHGSGLLLWGDVGTGKSSSAAFLVEALKKRFVPAIMTNFARFGDVRDRLPNFNGVSLLALDDLGAERQSDFMLERVFEIVDSRTRCGKPTVFTTNLHLDDLKAPENIKYKRLYSRVLERSIPIRFTGRDYRDDNRIETVEQAKKLFLTSREGE